METLIKKFIREEDGASAVEYAVLVGAIGAVLIAGIYVFYGKLNTSVNSAATKIGTSGK
ncbi:MAG TPA: Flp family type IVb pilin [Desulfobacterales bacterium]|nr:Flp family type IVb pilin [Desulfobacterales bacterium]